MSTMIVLLGSMALLVAVVGAIALSGTLSLNVLERIREIGVMRPSALQPRLLPVNLLARGCF